jgi:hypothetical protein
LVAYFGDRAVRLVLITRLIALISAPYTLFLVATTRPLTEQGFYFIFYNVQALAVVFEVGIAALVVQHASHTSAVLRWDGRHAFAMRDATRESLAQLLGAAERWYLKAAVVLAAVLLPGGVAFFHAEAERTGVPYVAAWIVVVVALALYVAVVPLLATLEGIGQIERVQQMRIAQGLVTTAVLWLGIPRIGGLAAVAAASIAQVTIAGGWLAARGQGIVREAIDALVRRGQREVETQFARTQWRTGAASIVGFAAPQLLGVVVFSAQGSRSSAQIGLSLAIATVPLTVATAWLQARYPRYARLIAEQRYTELDSLATRTTMASLAVFSLMTGGLLVALAVAVHWLPVISERILSPAGLIALFGSNLVMLLYQAMAGYLRAHREEPLLPAFFAGATATIIAAAVAARRSGNAAAVIYGGVAVGVMLPLIALRFLSQRRHRSDHLTS